MSYHLHILSHRAPKHASSRSGPAGAANKKAGAKGAPAPMTVPARHDNACASFPVDGLSNPGNNPVGRFRVRSGALLLAAAPVLRWAWLTPERSRPLSCPGACGPPCRGIMRSPAGSSETSISQRFRGRQSKARVSISRRIRAATSPTPMLPWSPRRRCRTATVPASTSLPPTTSIYGIFCTWASRIL